MEGCDLSPAPEYAPPSPCLWSRESPALLYELQDSACVLCGVHTIKHDYGIVYVRSSDQQNVK